MYYDVRVRLVPEHNIAKMFDAVHKNWSPDKQREEKGHTYRDNHLETSVFLDKDGRYHSLRAEIDTNTGLFNISEYRPKQGLAGVLLDRTGLTDLFAAKAFVRQPLQSNVDFKTTIATLKAFEDNAVEKGLKRWEGPLRILMHYSFAESLLKDDAEVEHNEPEAWKNRPPEPEQKACLCECACGSRQPTRAP